MVLVFLGAWLPRPDAVPFGIEGIGQQTAWQSYPYRMSRMLRGDLFAPEILAGYPLLAESEALPLYPLKLAFLFLRPPQALAVTWLLHFLLLFAGLHGLVFRQTRSNAAALAAGFTGVFTGPVLGTALGGHLSQLCAFAWTPWIAWCWLASLSEGRPRHAVLGGLLVLLSLAAGHVQYTLIGTVAALTIAVLGAEQAEGGTRPPLKWVLRILAATAGAYLAAGLWLLPLRELVSYSNRAAGFSPQLVQLGSLQPHQLLTALVPNVFGNTATAPYVGRLTYEETTCYLGIIPVLLVLSGLSLRKRAHRASLTLAVLGSVLALDAVAVRIGGLLGEAAPFQLPTRWRLAAWLGLSLLVGHCTARLLAGKVSGRRVLLAGTAVVMLLAASWGWLFPAGGWDAVVSGGSVELGLGLRQGLLLGDDLLEPAELAARRTAASAQFRPALAIALVGTAALAFAARRGGRGPAAPALVLLALLVPFWLFVAPLVRSVPWSACGWPEDLIARLRQVPGPFRVQPEIPFDRPANPFPKVYRQAFRNFLRWDKTGQDWGAMAGIESTTGGFSILTRSYANLTRIAGTSFQVPGPEARRRLNVRFVIASANRPPEQVHAVPLARSGDLALFEDPQALPRVTFFTGWAAAPGGKAPGSPVLSAVPGGPAPPPPPTPDPGGASFSALPYHRQAGPTFQTRVDAGAPGLVVFSELFYPGFRAWVNGAPAALYLAWDGLMAVPVPSGKNEVKIAYDARIWRRGGMVSLGGLAVLALLWILPGGGARRRRR